MNIDIAVEYCGTCGYKTKFDEFKQRILNKHPSSNIIGIEGRRASFEVKLNGELIHSKLCTMAFPDYDDISAIVSEVTSGNSVRQAKQQPVSICVII